MAATTPGAKVPRGTFTLAADLVDAGAFELMNACAARGVDPALALAELLTTIRQDDGTTTEGPHHYR